MVSPEADDTAATTTMERLTAPFPAATVQWRPTSSTPDSNGKVRLYAFIEARDAQARLDATFPTDGWSSRVNFLQHDGKEWNALVSIMTPQGCREDAGTGATAKAAVSDAFKRAAAQHGVARYLYYTPMPAVPASSISAKTGRPEREIPFRPDSLEVAVEKARGTFTQTPTHE